MEKNIEQVVRGLLRKHIRSNVNFEEITSTESLEDAGMNSIDFIKVIADLEMEYEIIFPDEELDFENFSTINNIVNFINSQLNME